MKKSASEFFDAEMTDVHSHILPGMDDGSSNAEESLEMLRAARDANIKAVIATPHFYAQSESPSEFLSRRAAAVEKLKEAVGSSGEGFPDIYVGAEVAYFNGIGYSDRLCDLCIEGTKCLLLEMPFYPWTPSVVEEVYAMTENFGVVPYLAHIERFIGFGNMKYIKELSRRGALLQSNAEFFLDKKTRKKALKLVKNGTVRLLGSDCHNTSSRPENLGEAIKIVESELSGDYIKMFEDNSDTLLFTAKKI